MTLKRNDTDEEKDTKETVHKLFKTTTKITNYRLFVGEFNSLDHELDEIVHKLSEASASDTLEVVISSPGGYLFDLMKVENVMRTNFYNRTKTILNPYGYSAGAFLFLCGDERLIYENSELMFHNSITGTYGKISDIESEIHHNKKHFENYAKNALKPYMTVSEFKELTNGKEFWMDALEICERKICTAINVFGSWMEPETYVQYRKDRTSRSELVKGLKDVKDYLSKKDRDLLATIR